MTKRNNALSCSCVLFLYAHLSFVSVSAASRKTAKTGRSGGAFLISPAVLAGFHA